MLNTDLFRNFLPIKKKLTLDLLKKSNKREDGFLDLESSRLIMIDLRRDNGVAI